MKLIICVTFVFFAIVKSQNASNELRFDILGCPFGWKASSQAWYAPKYEKDTWTGQNPAFAAQKPYSSIFSHQIKTGYFPREHILCLICENDLKSDEYQGSTRNQRWIEAYI